jgi:undecaprenyl diphosphate synthase
MSSVKEEIMKGPIPTHVAIIMDGNGRWAKAQGKERSFGHKNGVESVRSAVEASAELGVKYLTLYAFSTENWGRPKEEVGLLMGLLVKTIESETEKLHKNNVRIRVIGDRERLPEMAQKAIKSCEEYTQNNTGLTLILALSYSSKWEIVKAVKEIASNVVEGKVSVDDIDDIMVSNSLETKGIPDPDLLVRTSGEQRISNFLLWQIAYSELYFTDKMWPEFRKEDYFEAVKIFQKRSRRFGKTE